MGQGITTSSMTGRVIDQESEPLIGANVVLTHTPSGTTYGTSTDLNGYYRLPGIRVGGPYSVNVSFIGYQPISENGIYTTLGQAFNYSVQLEEEGELLDELVIVSSKSDLFNGNRTGQETVVGEQKINEVPTISRSIGDYARLNPMATIGEGNDGFTISLAGQNNRYNTIYIDGAVNNDVFGLAGNGTNGGQTGVSPISIDAIEQFQIAVAPFDVRQSGFAGGAINAVTRSGSNKFEGSAYYFFRNENLAGKTPTDREDFEREKLTPFSAKTYGFRLGGPIVKNKAFFFVNAELQRDDTPQPFNISEYNGNIDAAGLNNLSNLFQESYNYDLGNYDDNTAFLNSDKIIGKLDFNLSDSHKLSFRHAYTFADNLEGRSSSPFTLRFLNGSESFKSTTNSTALELNSLFGTSASNNFTIGVTIVRDDRDPFGDDFPYVFIEDGNGGIELGGERFSSANRLDQDVITINNNYTLYRGKHSILIGGNFEYFNAKNLFIRENFGNYRWTDGNDGVTGLDKFLAGQPADRYQRSFSQVDNVAGDESQAIAAFEQINLGLYVQDEVQVNENLKVTGGVRFDFPIWPTDQPENADFNNRVIPELESFYNLRGAKTGSFIGTTVMLSPRIGFNYDIKGEKTAQLRGGIGIFTSRIPLVWPGGAYNNYGFNVGGGSARNVEFVADVQNQPLRADLNNLTPSGQIDLFAEDFKLPQVLKLNVAYDRNLGNGYIASFEGIYSKNLNAIRYQNLNLKPNDRLLEGADNRPLFLGTQSGFGDDVIAPEYTYIMLASNTAEGESYNLSATLSKNLSRGLSWSLSYAYGDSRNSFDGTSSQNNSQWRGYHNVLGKNTVASVQRSSFAQGHRIFGQVSYELNYLDFGRTQFSLNFNGQTGGFYSYVVGARNFLFVDDGGFDNNELVYVPSNANELPLVDLEYNGRTYSPAEQYALLNDFIENDSHLSSRRGDYAERNGGTLPFEFTADFRLLQDLFTNIGDSKNTLQLSLDIFNFTNLINKDWGRRRFAGSFGNYPLVNLENNTSVGRDLSPEYTINTDLIDGDQPWTGNIDDSGFRSSRWQMQVGIRYIFK